MLLAALDVFSFAWENDAPHKLLHVSLNLDC